MFDIEELVKQCMDSGWFKTEENARRYVMQNCIPKPEPEYPQEDVFESSDEKERLYGTEGL